MSCVAEVVLLGKVITGVRTSGDATRIPFPEGVWFSYRSLCTIFDVTPKYLRKKIFEHRDQMSFPRVYRIKGNKFRRHRIFSEADYHFLRTIFLAEVGNVEHVNKYARRKRETEAALRAQQEQGRQTP